MNVCPDCFYEWHDDHMSQTAIGGDMDSNGAELTDGDAVTVVKDITV